MNATCKTSRRTIDFPGQSMKPIFPAIEQDCLLKEFFRINSENPNKPEIVSIDTQPKQC